VTTGKINCSTKCLVVGTRRIIRRVTVRLQTRGNSHVEAGWNTSAVALRVVVGGKKGNFESETVKYGRESHGSRTRE
jgi:hypothetical protein